MCSVGFWEAGHPTVLTGSLNITGHQLCTRSAFSCREQNMSKNWCNGDLCFLTQQEIQTQAVPRQVYWLRDRIAGLGVSLQDDRGNSKHHVLSAVSTAWQ